MWEQLSELTDEEIWRITRATFIYHSTWEIIDIGRLCNIVFKNIKTMLDRDREKYDEYIEKQSENGKKGGRPKKSDENPTKPKKPTAFSENPTKPKKADSDSVSHSASVIHSLSENKTETDTNVSSQAIVPIDNRNKWTQRIIDIVKSQVEQEGFLYDNNKDERNRATIIAKRQSDWWAFIKNTPDDQEEDYIRKIISFSNQNEYTSKIRSCKDFHEKWKKVANAMKESSQEIQKKNFVHPNPLLRFTR